MRGCRVEAFVDVGVEGFDDVHDRLWAMRQLLDDLIFAVDAVVDIGGYKLMRVFDGGAVSGVERLEIQIADTSQLGEIIAHIAIWAADNAGRPAHDMVAAKQGVLVEEGVADMVGGMARRVQGLDAPVAAVKNLFIFNDHVGLEAQIIAGLKPGIVFDRGEFLCAETIDLAAIMLGQRVSQRCVVEVVVGDEDMADALIIGRQGGFNGSAVFGQGGAGINQGDVAGADNVDTGAGEGEGAGVARDDASNARRDLLAALILKFKFGDEGNFCHAADAPALCVPELNASEPR